jgi:hypothetical protein
MLLWYGEGLVDLNVWWSQPLEAHTHTCTARRLLSPWLDLGCARACLSVLPSLTSVSFKISISA